MTSFSTSPADGTHIFDDFASNESIADGLIGKLNWDMTTIGNVSVPSYVAGLVEKDVIVSSPYQTRGIYTS